MLIKLIDEHLKARPKDVRAKRCFHPSSLHRSVKELYRLYLEGDNNETFRPQLLRVFDNGHGVHERLQRYLKEAGVLLQAEVPVHNEDYEIVGHTDGIVEIKGRRGILEIKSINACGFHSLYEPKAEHVVQINVYMFCTGIPRGVLLYENKDDQQLKEFYLKQDEAVLERVLGKIRTVQQMLKEGAAT